MQIESAREGAQQFEALLIGHVLKQAFAGDGHDEDWSAVFEFAQEQAAAAIAAGGGFGLAESIHRSIQPPPQAKTLPSTPPATPGAGPIPRPE